MTRAVWILIAGLFASSGAALAQVTEGKDPTLHVVILHNADYFLPASLIMEQALRETLMQESKRPIEFFAETLDAIRFPTGIDDELLALMRKKYAANHVDLVLARSLGGLTFARRHRDELWPDAPVVFYSLVADRLEGRQPLANSTGLLVDLDPGGAVELAMRVHPAATHLFIVGGTAEYDRAWKRRLQPVLSKLPPRTAVTWLDDLPYERILDELGRLPADSVVLMTSMVRDSAGRSRVNARVSKEIAQASTAPVYAFIDTTIGQGVVGGAVTDFGAQGRAAARLALRVLDGERADAIPVQPSPPAHCVIDARAMQRYGIAESLLPADCDIRFRPPSLWRDYRGYVVAGVAAILLQAAMIAALLFQRRRRRDAERETQHKRAELAQASRLALVGELTASIAHEVNQPLGAILSNIDAAEMVLEGDPAHLGELRAIHSDIRKGGLRAAEVIRRIRGLLGKKEVEWARCDANALVSDVVALLDPEARRRKLEIQTSLAFGLPDVAGDRVQLQQALLNLIINAMDAMVETPPESRVLTIRTTSAWSGVEIVVIDRGHGIAAEQLPRLFDSFFTTKSQGMGLGLSIARSVIDAHGGGIWAENNPDGGATFHLVLPAHAVVDETTRDAVIA
jgi:signal transduction histidine kinase